MSTPTTPPARAGRQVRYNLVLAQPLDATLRLFAANRRQSRRAVIEAALRAYLNPSAEEVRDTATALSLRRTENRLRAVLQTSKVLTETVGVLVQLYLGTSAEPVTREERQIFNDKLKRRWPRFMQLLTEVLESRSQGIYSHLPKELIATEADFPEVPANAAAKADSR